MSKAIDEYFAALSRLKQRKARINNDTVALEAGRRKGSIKKSRPQFAKLIEAIDESNQELNSSKNEAVERLARTKEAGKSLQSRLDAGLARELSLLLEVYDLRKELASLRQGRVVPIREYVQSDE